MYSKKYFDHSSPTWGDFERQAPRHNIDGVVGENIAYGQYNINQVMSDWMNSPGHRGNIPEDAFTHVGVAFYGGYWVQQFGIDPVDWSCDECGADLRSGEEYITAYFEYNGTEYYAGAYLYTCQGCGEEYFDSSIYEFAEALDYWDSMIADGDGDALDYVTWYDEDGREISDPFGFTKNSGSMSANRIAPLDESAESDEAAQVPDSVEKDSATLQAQEESALKEKLAPTEEEANLTEEKGGLDEALNNLNEKDDINSLPTE